MPEKICFNCQHCQRERTGPHEYLHTCRLHQRDYPNAEQCNLYDPAPGPCFDDVADDIGWITSPPS